MQASYRVKASELNQDFIDGLKATFGDQEIEIIVYEVNETHYLFQSPANKKRLLKAIENVRQGENLVEVSLGNLE
jgi:antitoxin YefM